MNKHYTVLLSPITNKVSRIHTERLREHDYVNEMGQKIWIHEDNHYYTYTSGYCRYTEKVEAKLIEARKLTFTQEVA